MVLSHGPTVLGHEISSPSYEFDQDFASLDRILALKFDCLEKLHLCVFNFKSTGLTSFLHDHTLLRIFELVRFAADEESWRLLLAAKAESFETDGA